MEIQLTKADIYQAVLETEASGIDTAVLCQRFNAFEPQRVHLVITKLVKESPPRLDAAALAVSSPRATTHRSASRSTSPRSAASASWSAASSTACCWPCAHRAA